MRKQCVSCDQWFTTLSDASACPECLNPPKRDWLNEETGVPVEEKPKAKPCCICKRPSPLMLFVGLTATIEALLCFNCAKALKERLDEL